MRRMSWITLLLLLLCALARAQAPPVGDYTKLGVQGDYVVRDFKFHTGEKLSELRQHYAAWGTPRHNASGEITNAVLLLHGTLGDGISWGHAYTSSSNLHPLLGPGGPLDTGEYYVIALQHIGHA